MIKLIVVMVIVIGVIVLSLMSIAEVKGIPQCSHIAVKYVCICSRDNGGMRAALTSIKIVPILA
jgi:hypothetical protein